MRMIAVAALTTIARLGGCVTHIRRADKRRRDQQRSDRHFARHPSAVPMALDLRTARMRKDPTLLVNDQKMASTSFFVAATVYLDAPTLAFDCRHPGRGPR